MCHLFGAWILARTILDTYAPLAAPTATKAVEDGFGFGADSSDDEDESHSLALQDDEEDMLIDTRLLSKRTSSKETAAAADEALMRVLEGGPSSLEAIKEAAGALKALITGQSA